MFNVDLMTLVLKWPPPPLPQLTLRPIALNHNISGSILHNVQPVDLWGVAEVLILDDLDPSLQNLCGWHTNIKMGTGNHNYKLQHAYDSSYHTRRSAFTTVSKKLGIMCRSSCFSGSWAAEPWDIPEAALHSDCMRLLLLRPVVCRCGCTVWV